MNDRAMPQKIDAEQAVLGSMFLSEKALERIVERLILIRKYLKP